MLSFRCALCNQQLIPANHSREHLLPNGIGGQKTVLLLRKSGTGELCKTKKTPDQTPGEEKCRNLVVYVLFRPSVPFDSIGQDRKNGLPEARKQSLEHFHFCPEQDRAAKCGFS
jgi:hypothetical protein